MNVFYRVNKKKHWQRCFVVHNLSRYIDLHFAYVTFFGLSPPQRNTAMWINSAYLDFQESLNKHDPEEYKEYNKEVYDEIIDRAVEIKKALRKVPKKEVAAVIKMEKMINRRSGLMKKFMQDFHSGLHSVQEYLIHGSRDAKKGDHVSYGSMDRIKKQLENLQIRQQHIYDKFMKVHNVVEKQRSLKNLGKRFKVMRQQLDELVDKIDVSSLERLSTKADHVVSVFNSIQEDETVWNVGPLL